MTRGDCGTANGLVRLETREIRIRPDVDDRPGHAELGITDVTATGVDDRYWAGP